MIFSLNKTSKCSLRSIAQKPVYYGSNNPLNIIVEEDESRSSSSSSSYSVTSPILDIKTRRRHATVSVSDIDRLSKVLPVDDYLEEEEEEEDDDSLLSSPRPAPQPPNTDGLPASPDSFRLNFTDKSFEFPLPPIPTPTSFRTYLRHAEFDSPSHSSSSLSSSPGSQTEALTPPTSDDESSPDITSRCPVIQPLVITKHNPSPFSVFDDDRVISPSLLQPFKTPLEILTQPSALLSPLSPSYMPDMFDYDSDETSDSEYESDSEWYSREFSKIISLPSPLTPCFPFPHSPPARPDSRSISFIETSHLKRRVSKPLPPIPSSGGIPSAQLDPAFPRKRRGLPKYPPPPIPSIYIEPSPPTSSCSNSSRRPPPRSSIPADCVYDIAEAGDVDDSSSTFSFSIYDVYLGGSDGSDSAPSSYSQSSFDDPIDEVTFDLEYPMMLPLSLPGTPMDLEGDIAQGLEELRNTPVDAQPPVWPAVATDAIVKPEIREPEQQVQVAEQPQPQQQQQQSQQASDDMWCFSPVSPTSSTVPPYPPINEEKILKSRWSTSTLASIREDHERRGSSPKWRLFPGQSSPLKNTKRSSSKKSTTPPPISSLPVLAPLRHKSFALPSNSFSSSPNATVAITRSRSYRVFKGHARSQSDMSAIGNKGNSGVRRRGSVTNSVSDAGSEDSWSSTSSSGLRRKPIPVEMFLRTAV